MTPYFLVLFAVVAIAFWGRTSGGKLMRWVSLSIACSILIAFAGLRNRSVGVDTGNYVRRFGQADNVASIYNTTEVGYNAINWIARSISESYMMILTLTAIIVVCCYVYTSIRLVRRYELAIFLFITLGGYTFFFNGARQGIAAAICFAALPSLIERRAVPYLVMVFAAALFHHSAVIAAPLYFVAVPRLDVRRLFIVGIVAIGIIVFLREITQFASQMVNERYSEYAEQGSGGGEMFAMFITIQALFFIIVKNRMGVRKDNYLRLLNIYLVGLIPVVGSVIWKVNPSGVLRLHPYFAYVAILMWPMVLEQVYNRKERIIVGFTLVIAMVAIFGLMTAAFGNLVPYRVNQELVSW